jgi:hypothetical protein
VDICKYYRKQKFNQNLKSVHIPLSYAKLIPYKLEIIEFIIEHCNFT